MEQSPAETEGRGRLGGEMSSAGLRWLAGLGVESRAW